MTLRVPVRYELHNERIGKGRGPSAVPPLFVHHAQWTRCNVLSVRLVALTLAHASDASSALPAALINPGMLRAE